MVEDGFEDPYMTHWRPLVASLSLSLPEGEDPRDVAQEAFARAFARWDRVSHHQRPDAWVFLTAYARPGKSSARGARHEERP